MNSSTRGRYLPPRVLHAVLDGAALPGRRVTPVVFRDELLDASRRDPPVRPAGVELYRHLAPGGGPGVPDARRIPGGPPVTHGQRFVVLAVKGSGDPGDRGAGHQLFDERNAAAPSVLALAPDID